MLSDTLEMWHLSPRLFAYLLSGTLSHPKWSDKGPIHILHASLSIPFPEPSLLLLCPFTCC